VAGHALEGGDHSLKKCPTISSKVDEVFIPPPTTLWPTTSEEVAGHSVADHSLAYFYYFITYVI
jgi:hypothetical protein